MRKFALSLLVALITINLLFPRATFAVQWWYLSTFEGWTGLYSAHLDEYYCVNEDACVHEQGHSEDNRLDWYSETREFQHSLGIIAECGSLGLTEKPFIQHVIRTLDDDAREVYATIYSVVDLGEYDSLYSLIQDYTTTCGLEW